MGFARYYGTVFRVAFTHSLSIAQSVIFALAILIGGLAYFVPKMQAILTPWMSALNGWQVATGILGSIVFARLVLAFYWTFDKEKRRANRAEQKIKGPLKFDREIRKEGDSGHYLAYATVRNTSIAAKLHNCYCEIVELQNDAGEFIQRQFPLGPRGQDPTESGSRFSLDQGAKKDIPLFEIDQLKGNVLYVIRAGTEKVSLDFGVYTARVCGYGDSGQPDEITVQADCRAVTFEVIA